MQVLASVFSYEEAAQLCGGALPDYISKVSPIFLLEASVLAVLILNSPKIMEYV